MNTEKLANVNMEIASVLKSCVKELRDLNDFLMGQTPSTLATASEGKTQPEPDGYFPYQTAFAHGTLQTAYDLSSEITRLKNCVRPGQEAMPETIGARVENWKR